MDESKTMEVACYNIYRNIIVEKKIIFLFDLIWLIIKYGCFRCYYPVFGSFSGNVGVHLEDMFMYEKYCYCGFGKKNFQK